MAPPTTTHAPALLAEGLVKTYPARDRKSVV